MRSERCECGRVLHKRMRVAASLTPDGTTVVNMLGVVKAKVAALSGGSVAGVDVDALSAKLACPARASRRRDSLQWAACSGLAPEKRQALV